MIIIQIAVKVRVVRGNVRNSIFSPIIKTAKPYIKGRGDMDQVGLKLLELAVDREIIGKRNPAFRIEDEGEAAKRQDIACEKILLRAFGHKNPE